MQMTSQLKEKPGLSPGSFLWPTCVTLLAFFAYAFSWSGGFLIFDDPWMIYENLHYQPGAEGVLRQAFFDFSNEARLSFGAEYLPLRDAYVFALVKLFGLNAGPLRLVQWCLYLGSYWLWRSSLLRLLKPAWVLELSLALFFLHPLHAESVAWLVGSKDVLGLLFFGLALRTLSVIQSNTLQPQSSEKNFPLLSVLTLGLLAAAATASKALFVVSPALLLLLLWARPEKRSLSSWLRLTTLISLPTLSLAIVQWNVAHRLGMVGTPPGGSISSALFTAPTLWYAYLKESFFFGGYSVVHDLPVHDGPSLAAAAGLLILLAWFFSAIWGLYRGHGKLLLLSFIWFLIALAPVAQLVVYTQNYQADRYLVLASFGPCILCAWSFHRLLQLLHQRFKTLFTQRTLALLTALLLLVVSGVSAERAWLFSDSVRLFYDATQKTHLFPLAPYQLGKAYEEKSAEAEALNAYLLALTRPEQSGPGAAAAVNNAARLLTRQGKLKRAEEILQAGKARFVDNAKIAGNLAEVVRLQPGRQQEAAQLYRNVIERFPKQKQYQERYQRYFYPSEAGE